MILQFDKNGRKFAVVIEFLLVLFGVFLCNAPNSLWAAPNSISSPDPKAIENQGPCPMIVNRLMEGLRNNYFTLFKRYFVWQGKYKKLNGRKSNPGDAMKREFAQMDARLFEEEFEKAKQVNPNSTRQEDIETNDYLFKLLTVIINELESKLEAQTASGVKEPALPMDEAAEKEAMERIKRIILRSFGGIVTNEVIAVARIALYYSLAGFVMVPGNPLFFMAPFVQLVVNLRTPMMIAYVQNVQMRAMFNVVDNCLPVTKMLEDWLGSLGKKSKTE